MPQDTDLEQGSKTIYSYEAQLSGIRCTGCTKKISDNLKEFSSLKSFNINVIGEKGLFHFYDKETAQLVESKIKSLGFKILNGFQEIKQKTGAADTTRQIHFIRKQNEHIDIKNLQKVIKKQFGGILDVQQIGSDIFMVKYNSKVVKGRQLHDFIFQQYEGKLEVYNNYISGFKKQTVKNEVLKIRDVIIALLVCIVFIIMALILPLFDFFEEVQIYPLKFNVITLYVIFLFLLTAFTLYYFGKGPIYNSIVNFKRYRIMNMETLVALGSLSAAIMSIFLIIIYFIEIEDAPDNMGHMSDHEKSDRKMKIEEIVHMLETAALILSIVTIGKYLEGQSKRSIIQMTEKLFPEEQLLANLNTKYIELKNKKFEIDVEKPYDISYIDKDDFILVEAPYKLLTDSTVVHIYTPTLKAIDQVCYGWNNAFEVKKGQTLQSGADITEGKAILQISNTIEDSMLFQISKQLNIAQNNSESSEYGIAALFKKLSAHFVKVIILIAFLSLIIWYILIATGSYTVDNYCVWCFPIERFISVLVASCPCALGLAIPSVIVVTLNMAMKNSILIKKNSVFEKIKKVQAIIFDKTGTLFTKAEKIDFFHNYSNGMYSDQSLWQIIQIIEKDIKHLLADLLYQESVARGCNVFQADYKMVDRPTFDGKNGLSAFLYDTKRNSAPLEVKIGNIKLMNQNQITIQQENQLQIDRYLKQGYTVLLVSVNKQLSASIVLHNQNNLRPEARQVVDYLQKNLKKDIYIFSGDHKDTVLQVGKYLGIPEENLIGECDANSKYQLLKTLKEKQNKEVMMIGDGLNDILSLQEACIGVSINAKSELNLMASDIVALNENLCKIPFLFELIKVANIFIYLNLCWSFAYNVLMIPMAAGVFEPIGMHVSPLISSASMSGSSIVVVLFSNLLRLFRFKEAAVNNQKIANSPKEKVNFNKHAIVHSKTLETLYFKGSNQNESYTVQLISTSSLDLD
ncbi:hypothetical protein ABPG72_004352 [Tetrahymena utriculariae]